MKQNFKSKMCFKTMKIKNVQALKNRRFLVPQNFFEIFRAFKFPKMEEKI